MILIKKRFLGKATGHNDHYISMGGQMSKIGGNWPLTDPCLEHRGSNINQEILNRKHY